MKSFSERLCFALDVRGVSQHALARSTGISQGAISNMARGKRDERIGFAMLMKISRAIRVDPEWLGEGRGAPPTKEEIADVLPRRALAVRLWREAGREEHAIERVLHDPIPSRADSAPTLFWVEQLQYAARVPPTIAPVTPQVERSHARPRADILPPTRRSSLQKK